MLFNEKIPFFLYSFGLLYASDGIGPMFLVNLPRNVASFTSQSYSPYYLIQWSGQVCLDFSSEGCISTQPSTLPAGEYKIRFSALKHFGNPMNPNDYEVFRTPAFI